MKAFFLIVAWCLLLVLCWPIALAAIVLLAVASSRDRRALPGLVPFTPTGSLANEYSTNPYTWGAGAAITSSSGLPALSAPKAILMLLLLR